MYRFALALVLSTQAATALAAGSCSVSGKAYDFHGKPLPDAVVRLIDLQTGQASFAAVDRDAGYTFSGLGGSSYRIDVLSPPTVVTGSLVPTRSILGMSDDFACSTGMAHQDVKVQVF
jgi:hypothetical protein